MVKTREACIIGSGTAVPPHSIPQAHFQRLMHQRDLEKKKLRYLDRILADSGIDTRHTVLSIREDGMTVYREEPFDSASTARRNEVFASEITPLVLEAAQKALLDADIAPESITHIISVTCTGFTNPGFDFDLIATLKLPSSVHRYTLGFMGCYGAFPALELAASISRSDPSARIMCICAELCSLHFQPDASFDDLLASTLFADGVGAVIVGTDCGERKNSLQIVDFHSEVLPDSTSEMAWSIGDTGFSLILSPYVSRVIASNVEEFLPPEWLSQRGGPSHWLIHPGGKSIIDRVQERLSLRPEHVEDVRATLRDFGNMSSATVLFALQRLRRSHRLRASQRVVMMGFGPGLTVKELLLEASSL